MKIVLLQTDIQWQSPDLNRKHAEELINASSHADLFILPEMFTTGFCVSPQEVAEKAGTETLGWMQRLAKEKNAALAGSVATEEKGKYYNRFYFVKPDGSYSVYDKRHLFSYGREDEGYTQGDKRVIVEYKGWRILLQICYDLRFPVFARNRGDYDMIIYVANWPVSRREVWNMLLRARTIENLCYVAAVNRVGNDPVSNYAGETVLINYKGQAIASANGEKEEIITGEIDMESLMKFRQKFPALQDGDEFEITI